MELNRKYQFIQGVSSHDYEDHFATRCCFAARPRCFLPIGGTIASVVEAVSGRMSVQFVDSRPAIRRLSSTKLVHGPLDWRHFNKHGYEALGETVSRAMQTVENINCSDGIESVSGNPS